MTPPRQQTVYIIAFVPIMACLMRSWCSSSPLLLIIIVRPWTVVRPRTVVPVGRPWPIISIVAPGPVISISPFVLAILTTRGCCVALSEYRAAPIAELRSISP
jgi:hypothetical protein